MAMKIVYAELDLTKNIGHIKVFLTYFVAHFEYKAPISSEGYV